MFQKRVEVCVVELQMGMGRPDIPACIRFQTAEQRGDKHDLMRAQMSYIGACKKVVDAFISQNSAKESIDGNFNGLAAANKTEEVNLQAIGNRAADFILHFENILDLSVRSAPTTGGSRQKCSLTAR